MNVGESIDVGVVLRFFLGFAGVSGGPVTASAAYDAAERLAGRSHQRLMAGLTALDVATAWPTESLKARDDQAAREEIVQRLRRTVPRTPRGDDSTIGGFEGDLRKVKKGGRR